MGLIRLLRLRSRAQALLDRLDAAAAETTLYREPRWQRDTLFALRELVAVLPLPTVWRTALMGLLANLLKNWKTTLIGLASGAGIAFLSGVQGGLTPKDAAIAAAVAALGLAAKDSTVSGK